MSSQNSPAVDRKPVRWPASEQDCSILVTGAAGWIGSSVCRALKANGLSVTALGPNLPESEMWDERIEIDITNNRFNELSLARAHSALVHCAGYAHRPAESDYDKKRCFEVNRDGSTNVVNLCRSSGIQRIVYVSTIAFYDFTAVDESSRRPIPLAENGALSFQTAYARSKYEGECAVRESGLDWRIARLATVFGEGDRANFARLASFLKKGLFFLPGKGVAQKSLMPINLAADIIAQLAILPAPKHRLMNVGLPEAPDLSQICCDFSYLCGFPKARAIPSWILEIFSKLGDRLHRLSPNFPLSSRNLMTLTRSTVVDVRRMQEVFPDLEWGSFRQYLEASKSYYKDL